MANRWSKPSNKLLNFNYGTRVERKEETARGSRSSAFRGRSRSRARKEPSHLNQDTHLISFPPLVSTPFRDKEGEKDGLSGWNSLFKEPKKVRKERVLSFFKPLPHAADEIPFVIVPEEAVARESKIWEKCLVAYVVGKRPHFQILRNSLDKQWKLHGSYNMHTLPGGFFLFSFNDDSDREKILQEGPWNFYGRPIVMEWSRGMELKKESFNSLPIWIRLPNLDFRFWDAEAINKIASVVGHPRFVDEATANRERLAYARACVEITPACEFPARVNILVGTKWTEQPIHYEWRPFCCTRCNTFEHAEINCKLTPAEADPGHENHERTERLHSDPGTSSKEWTKVDHRKKGGKSENCTIQNSQIGLNSPEKVWREKSPTINALIVESNAFSHLEKEGTNELGETDMRTPNEESLKKKECEKESLEECFNDAAADLCTEATGTEPLRNTVHMREDIRVGVPENSESEGEDELSSDTEEGKIFYTNEGADSEDVVGETPEYAIRSTRKVDGHLEGCKQGDGLAEASDPNWPPANVTLENDYAWFVSNPPRDFELTNFLAFSEFARIQIWTDELEEREYQKKLAISQ